MHQVDIDDVIHILNDMVRLDPEAAHQLVETRYLCNNDLADHPTIQVMGNEGKPVVGFLGVLNGIFGADDRGIGYIRAVFDDDTGKLTGFYREL
jgi:hypothetical protein